MPDTHNSPEYKILFFLNDHSARNNSKLSKEDILIGSKIADSFRFEETFNSIKDKYFDKRTDSEGGGYKITPSGEARLGELASRIETFNQIKSNQ